MKTKRVTKRTMYGKMRMRYLFWKWTTVDEIKILALKSENVYHGA